MTRKKKKPNFKMTRFAVISGQTYRITAISNGYTKVERKEITRYSDIVGLNAFDLCCEDDVASVSWAPVGETIKLDGGLHGRLQLSNKLSVKERSDLVTFINTITPENL